MSGAIAWLRAHVDCVEDRRSLVHNDMVFHNILGDGTRVTAVLDWEQASIGHPAEDLGYVYPLVTAMIDWDRFMDAYCAAGGAPVSQEQVDFFCLRGLLRLMNLVMAGGRDAFEGGHADGVLVASAGAFFTQRLLHKASRALDLVLSRESPSR
jgi:aminoglycoside phosphotransferase (APT) family kinase protein